MLEYIIKTVFVLPFRFQLQYKAIYLAVVFITFNELFPSTAKMTLEINLSLNILKNSRLDDIKYLSASIFI